MENNLIELNNCGVVRNQKWLVRGVSLKVSQGEIVTLIGPNGSGKSTTAKMCLNILKPDEGFNTIKDDIRISYVPQKISIDWSLPLRVIDFVNLVIKHKNSEISDALNMTGIKHLIYEDVRNLSGGEFQRLLMARAIAKEPHFLVLDEPVQGVDFTGEIALYELIKKISDELNCGILLISHDLHTVMSATDHVVCLNGHVCCSGSPIDVARNNEYKALFGEQASKTLAIYEHKHDHTHSNDGEIKKN